MLLRLTIVLIALCVPAGAFACSMDSECMGGFVCVGGQCVEASAAPPVPSDALKPAGTPPQLEVSETPPPLGADEPPALSMIPGTDVYAVPEGDEALFFYDGLWYRLFNGRWYSTMRFAEPWVYMRRAGVPKALVNVPPDYHNRIARSGHLRSDDVVTGWRQRHPQQYKTLRQQYQQRRAQQDTHPKIDKQPQAVNSPARH